MPRYTGHANPEKPIFTRKFMKNESRVTDLLNRTEIIGVCPIDDCNRELSRQEMQSRQHELNHMSSSAKRIAGSWIRLTDEQKSEMAEFVARG